MIVAFILGISIVLQLGAVYQVVLHLHSTENRFYWGVFIVSLMTAAGLDSVFLYLINAGYLQSSYNLLLALICLVKSLIISIFVYWLTPKVNSLSRSARVFKARSERYRAIFDHAPEMLAFKDRQGVFLSANSAFCRFFGKESQSIVGKTDFDLFPEEQASQFQEKDNAALQAQHAIPQQEARVIGAEGKRVVQIVRIPVGNDGEPFDGILVAARDNTEIRNLEDSWSQELVEKANQIEVLRRQIQFERLVSAMAAHFIHADPSKAGREINHALQTIVELGRVDASFIVLHTEGGQEIDIPYQWIHPDLNWRLEDMTPLPVNGAPWWLSKSSRFDILNLTVSDQNPEIQDAITFMKSHNIQSFTAVPLVIGRLVAGYLGFVSLHEEKHWSREMLALFKLMGEMFVNVIRRKWDADKSNETNKKFNTWIARLEQYNRENTLVNEMENLLLVCRTLDEACPIIGRYCKRLFPTVSGALYILDSVDKPAERISSWGEKPPEEQEVQINECWGLRRGRAHIVTDTAAGPHCRHLGIPQPAVYLCLPLIAQGKNLGLLHVRSEPVGIGPQSIPESVQKLAEKVAEHIGLALSNLSLKNTLLVQAIRDPLTGLFNRRYMEETLERELHRSSRYGTPLGIVLIDLDEFKKINDTMGHDTGDTVLKAMGNLLQQFFRGEDVACRYGGDEFTIILPESTLASTWQRAEQLREEWNKIKLKHDGDFLQMPTISIGVAAFPDHGMKPEQLIQAADTAAYTAKSKGRDRVMLSSSREE